MLENQFIYSDHYDRYLQCSGSFWLCCIYLSGADSGWTSGRTAPSGSGVGRAYISCFPGISGTRCIFLLLWTVPYMWCRGHARTKEEREMSRIKGEFLTGSAAAALFLLLSHSPWEERA